MYLKMTKKYVIAILFLVMFSVVYAQDAAKLRRASRRSTPSQDYSVTLKAGDASS